VSREHRLHQRGLCLCIERESRARTGRVRFSPRELTAVDDTVVERDSSAGFESLGGLRENSLGGLREETD